MTDETRDDLEDTAHGTAPPDVGAEAATPAPAVPDAPPPAAEVPRTKACAFCFAEIDAMALRCNRCAGYLPPAEGTDFKQHWTMLFSCTALFLAAMWMPIEGGLLDLFAKDSIAGAFLAVFAGYGVLAGFANIFHRKMIMWPAFLAGLDGVYIVVSRGMQLVQRRLPEEPDFREVVGLFGSAWYVIAFASLLILWTLVRGVMSGARREQERRDAAKAARKR
jgi:hypothetical protein